MLCNHSFSLNETLLNERFDFLILVFKVLNKDKFVYSNILAASYQRQILFLPLNVPCR